MSEAQTQLAFDAPAAARRALSHQCGMLLAAFRAGQVLTVATALAEYNVFALSQRVGDLERAGYAICKGWTRTPGGARVRCYFVCQSPSAPCRACGLAATVGCDRARLAPGEGPVLQPRPQPCLAGRAGRKGTTGAMHGVVQREQSSSRADTFRDINPIPRRQNDD